MGSLLFPKRTARKTARVAVLPTVLACFVGWLAPSAAASTVPEGPRNLQIINGTPADPGEYPGQAAVFGHVGGGYYELGCGGTLVGSSQVLTAAHCVVDQRTGMTTRVSSLRVGLGHLDLDEFFDPANAAHVHRVVSIDPHFQYNRRTSARDVAMLWLDRPADVAHPNIEPVRVVFDAEDPLWAAGIEAAITGWGDTDARPHIDAYPVMLMEARVPMRSDAECSAAYGFEVDLTTMVCAGAGYADTCQGDSGGPLLVFDGVARVLAGVVSWGYGCNSAQYPGVYARIGDEPLNSWVHARREAAPPDVTAPAMALASAVLKLNRAGRIPARLTCPASEPRGCAGTVMISTRSRVVTPRGRRFVTFGRASFNIRGGATAVVTVNPSTAKDALIRRLRSVAVKVRVNAVDDYGQAGVRTFRRTLRAVR